MIRMQTRARTPLIDVVAQLAADGLEFFTPSDLAEKFGITKARAQGLAGRMTEAGLARRVRRPLYALLPPAEWGGGTGTAVDWYWVAANAVGMEPYYLAYYTAMEIHQMTQHPLRTVFVAVARRHRSTTFGPVRIKFVTLPGGKFFGKEDRRLQSGHVVKIAQLERTLIDGADRPELCGGIEEVLRGYIRRRADIEANRLIRFLDRLEKPVVTKRVGFLLEAAGQGDPELLWELERVAGRLRHYAKLDKTRPAEGTRNRRWELLINIDAKRLLAAART
jgi:predicted transcriptional regulator of viral defense system